MTKIGTRDPIFEFAISAVVRGRDPEWSAADQAALDLWRGADPRHAAALDRAAALWGRFEIVAPVWEQIEARPHRPSRRAVIGGIAGLGVLALAGHRLTGAGLFADYRTGAGESRSLSLPDGSAVDLGVRSALSLGQGKRHVALDGGEAFFRILPAPLPFTVSALGARIRAPASQAAAFAVRAIRDQGLLAVAEGDLTLAVPGQTPIRVAAGTETAFSRRGAGMPTRSQPGTVAPWRNGRVIFADTPLGEVVAELGRYRSGRVVTDPRVSAMRVTAVFDTGDIPGAFASIAQTLPVRVIDAGVALLVMAG